MMMLAYLIAGGMGLFLLGNGVYYHYNRVHLHSDPVLINACYLFGVLLVAACFL